MLPPAVVVSQRNDGGAQVWALTVEPVQCVYHPPAKFGGI
jgi:hypothetical protein